MRKYIIMLFVIGMITACTQNSNERVAPIQNKKAPTTTLQTFDEMEDSVLILTESQKDSLVNTQIIPPYAWYFNPVQDCDSVWIITQTEADECTNENVMFVKTLPKKLWCPLEPPPGGVSSL